MRSEPESMDGEGAHKEATAELSGSADGTAHSDYSIGSPPPVFVLGCPRSGTTLLYHMLLSAGGFAVYRTESSVFNVLKPCFGNLAKALNRQQLLDAWIGSRLFQCTDLDESKIRAKIMAECRSPSDFLTIVMEEICRRQNVNRWADCTPEHLLYIPEIKKAFPNALVIHTIRDGRDVALSLGKQRWIHPLLSRPHSALVAAGLYWEWIVTKGRKLGRAIAPDYMEVHFEDLILSPRETLTQISAFISQDLDYDKIQKTAIGSVNKPNTSFNTETALEEFAPVGRWKTTLSPEEHVALAAILSRTLRELGYPTQGHKPRWNILTAAIRSTYRITFETKLFLKKHTALGRILMKSDLSWL